MRRELYQPLFNRDTALCTLCTLSHPYLPPGVLRQPLKKQPADAERLLALLHRWRDEAVKAGRAISRIAVAFEAGRDGFWAALARRRGLCDPRFEPRGVARASPRQDRPARHRDADAGGSSLGGGGGAAPPGRGRARRC